MAGKNGGRQIETPGGRDTRPTTDRVREALFSTLYSLLGSFEGVSVIDACSGSGALGLEAMSRGACNVVLNDISPLSRKCIEKNIKTLGHSLDEACVTGIDVFSCGLPAVRAPYGLAFLDPPYATCSNDIVSLISSSFERGLLLSGAIVVYEHDRDSVLDKNVLENAGLCVVREKSYGKTTLTYITD